MVRCAEIKCQTSPDASVCFGRWMEVAYGTKGHDFSSGFSMRDSRVAFPPSSACLLCAPQHKLQFPCKSYKTLLEGRPWHFSIYFNSGHFSLTGQSFMRIIFCSLQTKNVKVSLKVHQSPLLIIANWNQLSWIWSCSRSNGPVQPTTLFLVQTSFKWMFSFDVHLYDSACY